MTSVDVEFAEGFVGNELFLCLVDAPARVALLPQERPALVRADLSPETLCKIVSLTLVLVRACANNYLIIVNLDKTAYLSADRKCQRLVLCSHQGDILAAACS